MATKVTKGTKKAKSPEVERGTAPAAKREAVSAVTSGASGARRKGSRGGADPGAAAFAQGFGGPTKLNERSRGAPGSGTTGRITVTLVKSTIGFDRKQAAVVRGLGLRGLHHTVDVVDTPAMRGMIHKVRHLVHVR
jgi:large subunit ribosomal protein L30